MQKMFDLFLINSYQFIENRIIPDCKNKVP